METTKKDVVEPKEQLQAGSSPEAFAKEYQDLCERMGHRIVVNPQYVARDDNSFSTVLQYTVGQLPKSDKM